MRLAWRQSTGCDTAECSGGRMRKIGRAGRHSGRGHAVHVAAEICGRRASMMARVDCGRWLLNGMIAVSGLVIVNFDLLKRFGLSGMHRRLGHRDHAGLKRGNDKHGDGEKGTHEGTLYPSVSARILHIRTTAISGSRKSRVG